jgi:dihydroorotate dehydrogenase (fumarate)
VLLEGLRAWIERKGFTSVDELRGMLSVAPSTDETEHARAGYVSALREANSSTYGPW